jgi:hypothetical protein
MTLAELKADMRSIHPGGRYMADDGMLKVHQKRAFSKLFEWCEPLNLLIAYDDRDIAKIVDSVWRLKKPLIAESLEAYIDIDERLDTAFTYLMISLLITGNGAESKRDKAEFEEMAYREALEYAISVQTVGYDNAKRVYEQESFIEGVEFDCLGRVYLVSRAFVDKVIDCILCGRQCLSSAEAKQLELYKKYIAKEVRAVDKEKLSAVDKAVFHRLVNDPERLAKYSNEDLAKCSTLFCEFSKLDQDGAVDEWVNIESKRMGWMECDKPMCRTNNRCGGI